MPVGARMNSVFLGVAVLLLGSTWVDAATRNAASCSTSAVQAAVNSAVSGDAVVVPTGACTWSSGVDVPNGKKITIQGAGSNSTVITGTRNTVFELNQSGSRLTGFGIVEAAVHVDGDDWRIDHNRFTSTTSFYDAILVFGDRESTHPRGLIDHNQIQNTRISVVGWNSLMAHAIWAQPLGLGGAQMVFVEDNTFTGTQWASVVDGNYGGRYVFRYNTVTNMYIEAHSNQGERGIRSWEIYNNKIIQSGSVGMWTPFYIRGGTGVVFNNTISGTWSFPGITLDNVRSFESRGSLGQCNGNSPWDGNQASNGWPCRDQIGRSTDQWVHTSSRPYPPQASEPAYFWGNTASGSAISVDLNNGTSPWIVSGRDYLNNTPKPGYTPYAYPHPLASGGTTPPPPAPAAPSNVRVIR